jgi:hypothetical protein
MRLSAKLAIGIGVMIALAGYGEVVLDIRTPHSRLVERAAVGTDAKWIVSELKQIEAAMTAKYGPGASTTFRSPGGNYVTEVDHNVVQEGPIPHTFAGVEGLFVLESPDRVTGIFPFRLDPQGDHPPDVNADQAVKDRFKDKFPARYLAFGERDVTQGSCVAISAPDLGMVGTLLRLRSGTFCMVYWNGDIETSMLIGAVLVDGDPWMRPFARRICRSLTSLALGKLVESDPQRLPTYAACLLIDRPSHVGTSEALQIHAYEVGRSASLALIEPRQARSASPESGIHP